MYNFDVHVKKISRHTTNTCAFYQIEYLSYCVFFYQYRNQYVQGSIIATEQKEKNEMIPSS